jgi:AcrR family transcriptional regulator
MAKTPQPRETRRRLPTQARAEKTIETILAATAHILRTEGEAALTTNRIAQRAGFSIGSVYQYFPDKAAILLALAQRERQVLTTRVGNELRRALPQDLESVARIVLKTLIDAITARQKGRKTIVLNLLRHQEFGGLSVAADELAQLLVGLLSAAPHPQLRPLNQTSAFIWTRAIQGVMRAAVLEDQPFLATQEFEDGLVHLVVTFLRAT